HYGFEMRLIPGRNPENYFRVQRLRTGGDNDYQPGIRPDVSGVGYMGTSSYRLWRSYVNHLHYYDRHRLSKRDWKENIRSLTPDFARSVFDKIQLRKFNYKRDGSKRHLASQIKDSYGTIIDESPAEIISEDGESIVTDNYINIIAGTLKHEIARNNLLKRKIEKLEEKIS